MGTAIGLTGSIAGAIGGALGVGAGLVSTVASVAFQVTGINDKINKAASKVFGEDLVGFANIAGMAYGAINGGFDIGKAGEAGVAGAGEALSKATLDGTTDLGFNSAAGAYDVASGSTNTLNGLQLAGDALSKSALDGTNAFGANSAGNSFNLAEQAGLVETAAPPTPEQGTNMMNQSAPLNSDSKAAEMQSRSSGASERSAAGSSATADSYSQASAPNAAAESAAGAQAAGGIKAPGTIPPKTAPTGNVVSRLFGGLSEKERLGMLQSAGSALTSAMQSKDAAKQRQAELDWQKSRYYNSAPSVRVVG